MFLSVCMGVEGVNTGQIRSGQASRKIKVTDLYNQMLNSHCRFLSGLEAYNLCMCLRWDGVAMQLAY